MTKIVFFDVKPYDKKHLEPMSAAIQALPMFKDNPVELVFKSTKLNPETVSLAEDADVVALFVHDKITSEMMAKMPKLRMIACRSAGFDYVDLKEAAKRGIKVANVPSYSPNSIAEFAVGLIINLARNLRMAFERSRHGDFKLTPKLLGFEMRGKNVGVFGTGKIGKIVCEILRGFKMNVIAFDLYRDDAWAKANGVEYAATADEIYSKADVISLHAPLTAENFHMINAQAIEKMKKGVLIVNTGRGALIDTKSLIDGLKTGKVGGVALDVYENENNVFDVDWYSSEPTFLNDDCLNQLLSYPNALITSHQAYFTNDALEQIAKTSIDNICEFFEKSASASPDQFKLKNEVK